MEILWFLIVGLVAGWLASMLAKGGGYGLLGDMVVGVLGALLGGFLFSTLGGISMFGILGIIIGPIIAALFITLWELYGQAFEKYLPAVGLFSSIHSSGPAKERPEDIHLFGNPEVRGELEENSGSGQNMTNGKTPGESQ